MPFRPDKSTELNAIWPGARPGYIAGVALGTSEQTVASLGAMLNFAPRGPRRLCYRSRGVQEDVKMKATFYSEFIAAARQGPRLFFAPLVGAIRAIRDESARIGGGDLSTKAKGPSKLKKFRRIK